MYIEESKKAKVCMLQKSVRLSVFPQQRDMLQSLESFKIRHERAPQDLNFKFFLLFFFILRFFIHHGFPKVAAECYDSNYH